MADPVPNAEQARFGWFNSRWVLALLVVTAALPLLWPTIPPLVDVPGHMARYRVQLDGAASVLRQFYSFHWSVIGNLGVDLLVIPLAPLFGLELATKLIVMATPPLAVAAMLWIAREVHGRVPPTAFFALPLAYGHPFLFGFANFSLSMALALLSFAAWLRLARLGRIRRRAFIFLLVAPALWLTHTFGWGVLGVLAFSAEVQRCRETGCSWFQSVKAAVLQCLVLAPPLLAMLMWRHQASVDQQTGDWFNWAAKLQWITMTLRDRWHLFDVVSVGALIMLIAAGIRDARLRFSPTLATGALALLLVFLLLPRVIFGSAYADMRLTPYMFALAILAIRPTTDVTAKVQNWIAIGGVTFFAVRIAATTASLFIAGARHDRALAALDHVPAGARLISFTQRACGMDWSTNRMEHLSGMAVVRRRAFSNDQWDVAGAELLRVIKADAPGFVADPSQMVVEPGCVNPDSLTLDDALAKLPRGAFDYVWLMDPPRYDVRGTAGMTAVWRDGTDVLLRIDRK